MPRLAAALGVALALAALALALWPQRPARRPDAPAPAEATAPPAAAPEPRRLPAGNALAAALGEEQVALASGVVVEAVEQDAPWACAGEPLGLFARVGGDAEPGAITRWLWPGEAGIELSPGATLSWRAPRAPGRYPVRVQVCKDLGGRQVGVLAERVHEIDVRSCDAASRGTLRLLVTRLAVGTFAFEATRAEGETPAHYLWDFDDGSPLLEAGPRVEHVFAASGLGPHDVRAFAVRASGHLPGAEPLEATAFAVVRGRPAPRDAPPVELDLQHARPAPGGGWHSALTVRVPSGTSIRWERVERIVQFRDDRTRTAALSFAEAIRAEEHLERGGFRGDVVVSEADAGDEVKQIHDTLRGRDEAGSAVAISWTPFKRRPPEGVSPPEESIEPEP